MRSFQKSFAKTVKIASLADEAIIQSDESYEKPFADVWEEYQKTLNLELLNYTEEPFLFEIKLERDKEAQGVVDDVRREIAKNEKTKDPSKFSASIRKLLSAVLVSVHNCEGFPDPAVDMQAALDAVMNHGHGVSLFLTMQQYENRALTLAATVKKS